jgi:hypothetical protein
MAHGQLAHDPVAGQAKAQSELRSKVPARITQLVRLGLSGESESEESLNRTAVE